MAWYNFFRATEGPAEMETASNYSVGGRNPYVQDDDLKITENRSQRIYNFGLKNDYPKKLIALYDQSPTNQAVINRTALMIAGGDTELKVHDPGDLLNYVHALQLQMYPNEKQNLEQIIQALAFDIKLHGRYAIEAIWNEAHTRVTQIKAVDVQGVRIGQMENGKITTLWYCSDWSDSKAEKIPYEPFDKYGKGHRQLLHVQYMRSGHGVYGLPDYYASLKWIELEKEIGAHYLDSAQNGFSPKMSVVFPGKPESEDLEDKIMDRLNKRYTGSQGRRIIGIFAPRPEAKPEFNPITVENLDKQYKEIDDQTQGKILTGHGVVSPMLFGIKTAGQLGGAQELETAFNIYQNTVIATPQNMIQRSLDEIMEASDNPNRINLTKYNLWS